MKDDPTSVSLTPLHLGDLDNIEGAVWAAEYVRYLAARSDSTKRWPPDEDDVDDAIDNANETVIALRRARERNR